MLSRVKSKYFFPNDYKEQNSFMKQHTISSLYSIYVNKVYNISKNITNLNHH
jgi:hypothetical protein